MSKSNGPDLAALKAQHGRIEVVEFDDGRVVVLRKPSRAQFDSFIDSERKQAHKRQLVDDCRVHPSAEELVALLDEYPAALAGPLTDAALRLAGVGKARVRDAGT